MPAQGSVRRQSASCLIIFTVFALRLRGGQMPNPRHLALREMTAVMLMKPASAFAFIEQGKPDSNLTLRTGKNLFWGQALNSAVNIHQTLISPITPSACSPYLGSASPPPVAPPALPGSSGSGVIVTIQSCRWVLKLPCKYIGLKQGYSPFWMVVARS
jgi:hypothetical protein